MTQELETVKSKIRNLAAKTVDNGCSEAEAMSAATMIDKLLHTYNLQMDEIILHHEPCKIVRFNTGKRKSNALRHAVMGIGNFTDCVCWIQKVRREEISYSFFGLESDADMAYHLCNIIYKAMQNETQKFKLTPTYKDQCKTWHGKTVTNSFQVGMAERIHHRLNRMKKERDDQERRDRLDLKGTELVLAKKKKVDEEFKKQSVRLRPRQESRSSLVHDAFIRGHKAGGQVNLNRPVEETTRGKLT